MFGKLHRYSKRKQAQKARQAAYDRLKDAEARGDTRSIGKARMDLVAATTELLKLEPVKVVRR